MKKAVIVLSWLSIFMTGCSSLLNPTIHNSLKEVRASNFLKNEDKTKTIGGIDANNNGVRDDIEGYIKLKYANNPEFISVYMQYAKELRRKMTLASEDRETYRRAAHEASMKMVCASEIDEKVEPEKMYQDTIIIHALTVNTKQRRAESNRISSLVSGMVFTLPTTEHCRFYKN
ncbi:hypothetical protein HYG89_05325 [Acinetobacter sp. SwsAc5]|uniref:hypothetical protein n=1 Tax=Acinetobacter sp. SwsAc5 TaxID=2749438 RepID=UPI0015BD0800|nr:hypothetical protein [Acinetobacter sp. SwsAc5]NWK51989.1 hypothetical protein [Acinetobacter sp. SwsAc5]